jgi:hypothetical protein
LKRVASRTQCARAASSSTICWSRPSIFDRNAPSVSACGLIDGSRKRRTGGVSTGGS